MLYGCMLRVCDRPPLGSRQRMIRLLSTYFPRTPFIYWDIEYDVALNDDVGDPVTLMRDAYERSRRRRAKTPTAARPACAEKRV